MTDLYLHSRRINTVFDLLGDKENDITFSVGWALAQSETFLKHFVRAIFPQYHLGEVHSVSLQDYAADGGYTDIEIVSDQIHLIIEAKRGWNLPRPAQLTRYRSRFNRAVTNCAMVVISECASDYARPKLPAAIHDVPVRYLSWEQVHHLATVSRSVSQRVVEKQLLTEVGVYLKGLMNMQQQESNLVYVVALSREQAPWSSLTWIEFVTKKRLYFHPYGGNGWPVVPPNYLGFRYDGQLQSIHHVKTYQIVNDLSEHIPEIESQQWHAKRKHRGAFVIYKLDPPIIPSYKVKTGNIYPSGRVRAAIDLLLTSKTISDARDLTKKRLSKVPK